MGKCVTDTSLSYKYMQSSVGSNRQAYKLMAVLNIKFPENAK